MRQPESEVGVEVDRGRQFNLCRCRRWKLTQFEAKFEIDKMIIRSGLTIIGRSKIWRYDGESSGYVEATALAESHLVIATWPEDKMVRVTLSVCNYKADNSKKREYLLRALEKFYNPEKVVYPEVRPDGTRMWR